MTHHTHYHSKRILLNKLSKALQTIENISSYSKIIAIDIKNYFWF